MKTKIIYISGNETFEMADIRAAFNEVRETLGLDSDTVLFGVPVDNDSAFQETKVNESETAVPTQQIPAQEEQSNIIEPEIETKTPNEQNEPNEQIKSDKIIPILSILSANQNQEDSEVIEPTEIITQEQTSEKELSTEADTKPDFTESEEQETVSIEEIMTSDAPEDDSEKTLEELLESMTPLKDDRIENDDFENFTEETEEADSGSDNLDSDATLTQLANEFAETEDKIIVKPKSETHGKIGKLKNILPFKKAKRDDTGLMGDLFGWAGIAANDEDISIPGFFSNGTQKK